MTAERLHEMERLRAENDEFRQSLNALRDIHDAMSDKLGRLRAENAELRQAIRKVAYEYEFWDQTSVTGNHTGGTWHRERFESWLNSAVEQAGLDEVEICAEAKAGVLKFYEQERKDDPTEVPLDRQAGG